MQRHRCLASDFNYDAICKPGQPRPRTPRTTVMAAPATSGNAPVLYRLAYLTRNQLVKFDRHADDPCTP